MTCGRGGGSGFGTSKKRSFEEGGPPADVNDEAGKGKKERNERSSIGIYPIGTNRIMEEGKLI